MIRIVYCTDFLMAGGVEAQTVELLTRLDRARFDPQIICLYGPKSGFNLHLLPKLQQTTVPFHVFDLGWSPADKIRGVVQLARYVWQLRPHILQLENYHANLLGRMARPLLPPTLKLIGTVRGNYTSKQLLYERISQWACTSIVTNGPQLRRQLIEQAGTAETKTIYIPNGVDLERFGHNPDPGLRARIAPGASRVLVSLGRISAEKQMHLLAEGIGRLRQHGRLPDHVRLFIVGTSQTPAMQQLLDQTIAACNLQDVVEHHTETLQPEAYYHAADATILFSPAEGLPNVVLESLAAVRPVIISEAANAAGIIEQDVTGWIVRTGDVDHLADVLFHVLTLPTDDLRRMRPACDQRAQDFSMGKMVERYEELYESLT